MKKFLRKLYVNREEIIVAIMWILFGAISAMVLGGLLNGSY